MSTVVSRVHAVCSSANAFRCAGVNCKSDPSHVAVRVVRGNKWKCSIRGHQSGGLSEGQLMWLGESGVRKQDPSTTGK